MTYKQSLVVAVLVAMASACGGRDPRIPSDAQELGLLPVESSQTLYFSQFHEPARLVIRDQQEWSSAWSKLGRTSTPPPVDFEKEMVVLVAMGRRNTGGYSIEIQDAAANFAALFISVMETSPGERCGTIEAVTQPVALARVARYDGEIRFLEGSETRHCL